MTNAFGFTKYRARLGDEDEPEFAIVTVMDNGTVSWTVVSEGEFEACALEDLPDALYGLVNGAFGKLQFSDDDIAGGETVDHAIATAPHDGTDEG